MGSIRRSVAAFAAMFLPLAAASPMPGGDAPLSAPAPPPGFAVPWAEDRVATVRSSAREDAAVKAAKGYEARGRRLIGVPVAPMEPGAPFVTAAQLHWQALESGGAVARFRVASSGAKGLRLGIAFDPEARGVQLRFRGSDESTVAGVLEARGSRSLAWGPVAVGAHVDVEAFAPPGLDWSAAGFSVVEVSHLFQHPLARNKALGDSAPCERDVACYSLGTAASNNQRATVLIAVTDGGSTYSCTGTLLNTRSNAGTPYLLTTADCVPSAAAAATINTWWGYQASTCGSGAPGNFVRQANGATLLERNTTTGFSFVRLADAVPSIGWRSGWDPAEAAVGTPIVAIHHPEGDLKKMSVGSITRSGATPYVRFTTGVTENGSVGSGIFHGDQYLTGILIGGSSSCANPSAEDFYAGFSEIYPALRRYLDDNAPQAPSNYSDIWWNPQESGWGLTIADHETQLFVVWYTYRQDGSPTWFVIPGGTLSQGRRIFTGDAYQTTGPRYDGPFNPAFVTVTRVGSITIDFAPTGLAPGTALFTYSIAGVSGTRQIQRQPFGDAAPAWGSDFTDIWWDSNESGWGLTLSQHGNNVFGVWYTYDTSGQPLFLVMPGVTFTGSASFTGALYQTTGPYFGAPYDASRVTVTQVGNASIDMQSITGGSRRAQFRPTVRGVSLVRNVTPQPFGNSSPGNTQPQTFTLTVGLAGTGSGSVTSNPAGIACPGTCSASFPRGSTVTLSASPLAGSRFTSFTGTCSTAATSCAVTMSANASVTATFERLPAPSTLAITAVVPLPNARPGVSYSSRVATATGGTPPYSFMSDTFANGAPPLGMIIDLNGFLTGTPSSSYTSRQTFTFGVCVRDIQATSRCTTNTIVVDPQPPQDGTIRWNVGNQCNNGSAVEYKFHDRVNRWVWPSATTHYVSNYNDPRSVSLSCTSGANVCLGARSSGLSWGVGYDGTSGCSDCCGTCDGRTYSYTFACGGTPPPSGPGQCTGLLGGPRACQPCNSDADCGGNICWTGARPAPFCG